VIAVLFPKARLVAFQKFQPARPFHGLPSIPVRNNQPNGKAVIGRQRFAVMMRGEQDAIAIEIGQRHVGRVALFGMDENSRGPSVGHRSFQNLFHGHAGPTVIEATPTRHTVKVAVVCGAGQFSEFPPVKLQRILYETVDPEIPPLRIESRYRPVMKNRPFECQGLARRQAARRFHSNLAFPAFVPLKQHRRTSWTSMH